MKMRCIIVDDEPMARKSLQRLCEKLDALEIVDTFENAETALTFLEDDFVDLLFLDVEMPGLSGIQLLDRLPVMPQVILTTSKTEYAFDAYQYHVSDYLKKPITFPRLEQAVQKALEAHQKNVSLATPINNTNNDIFVKSEGRFVRINFDDILYIESVGDYLRIKTPKSSFMVHGTIKAIDEKLPTDRFIKVHRAYIVSLSKIVDIEDTTLVVADKMIPISRAHRPLLMNKINML